MRVIILENADLQVLSMVLGSSVSVVPPSIPASVSTYTVPEGEPSALSDSPLMDALEGMGVDCEWENSSLASLIRGVIAECLHGDYFLSVFLILNRMFEKLHAFLNDRKISFTNLQSSVNNQLGTSFLYRKYNGNFGHKTVGGRAYWYSSVKTSKMPTASELPGFIGQSLVKDYIKENPGFSLNNEAMRKSKSDIVAMMVEASMLPGCNSESDYELYVSKMLAHVRNCEV